MHTADARPKPRCGVAATGIFSMTIGFGALNFVDMVVGADPLQRLNSSWLPGNGLPSTIVRHKAHTTTSVKQFDNRIREQNTGKLLRDPTHLTTQKYNQMKWFSTAVI